MYNWKPEFVKFHLENIQDDTSSIYFDIFNVDNDPELIDGVNGGDIPYLIDTFNSIAKEARIVELFLRGKIADNMIEPKIISGNLMFFISDNIQLGNLDD